MASTVEQPFLNPNCTSEIQVLLLQKVSTLLFNTVVNNLEKKHSIMLFLDNYLRHFLSPFLCSGITIPSLQESGKTPKSKMKMSQINGNNISIVSIKYSFKDSPCRMFHWLFIAFKTSSAEIGRSNLSFTELPDNCFLH